MRVVIVGGGTAGHMALAHVSKHWPDVELLHVFDSQRPTIGVGEGTTPDFIRWLDTVGISFDDLVTHCQATCKRGISFEGWGRSGREFEHEFLPRSLHAVHFSATKLPVLLAAKSDFSRIDDSVQSLQMEESCAVVLTTKGQRIEAELVIDARGFPRELSDDIQGFDSRSVDFCSFDWVTTNSALVTKTPSTFKSTITRAVARKLGWVFCIPLAKETSFGYVYNSELTSQDEASEDFHRFLSKQNVTTYRNFRPLTFPNFGRRDIFQGRVFHIGNCASFLEPLEATAIGVVVLQLHLLSHWRDQVSRGTPGSLVIERINRLHEDTLLKISVFIAWHYASGSIYDTPFWQVAADRFRRIKERSCLKPLIQQLDQMQKSAETISPITLAKLNSAEDIKLQFPNETSSNNFGGYSKFSFAQIAGGLNMNGLGFNDTNMRHDDQAVERQEKRA